MANEIYHAPQARFTLFTFICIGHTRKYLISHNTFEQSTGILLSTDLLIQFNKELGSLSEI